MTEDKQIFRPRAGMRFKMRGSEFEVCFAEIGIVRYAAVKGGKPHRIPFKRFYDLQREDEIKLTNPELHGQDAVNGAPSLANLTDKELKKTMRCLRYAEGAVAELPFPNSVKHLKAWIPTFAKGLGDSVQPEPRTVSRWVYKYLRDGKDAFMWNQRKCGNRTLHFPPEIEILTLEATETFLSEEHRDGKDVLAYIVGKLAEQGLLTKDGTKIKIPSERTIRRHLNRIDPYLLTRIKKGVLAADKMARAAGKMITSPRPLHLVEIDTHFLKIFVIDPDTGEVLGKPYLTCAIDVRTRCIVGIFVSLLPASTTTTLAVVKDMLTRPIENLPGGVPVYIIPDNGVEFKNSGVERLFTKLCVHFEPAMVRDPNGKPHIESFFRTLSLFLIQKIKGTTFSNLEARGVYYSEGNAYATIEKIEEYVRDWVENEYHQRPHSGTGRVPIKHWEEETAKSKPMSLTKEEVNALARRPYRCRINRGQVRAEKLDYYSHALSTIEDSYKGSVTVLVNEMDLKDVLVEHPFEKSTLITADSVDPEYTRGLSMWEHEEAQKIKAQMTEKDLKAVGKYASLLARYRLLQKLQKDSTFARSKIAKLTQGKGRLSQDPEDCKFEDAVIQTSALETTAQPATLAEREDMRKASTQDGEQPVPEDRKTVERKADTDTTRPTKRKNTIYYME